MSRYAILNSIKSYGTNYSGRLDNLSICMCTWALSCQFGERGQSEYHSEKANKVYALYLFS